MSKRRTIECLFIPLETIYRLKFTGFKNISKMHDLNKQLSGLENQQPFKTREFLVPLKCLAKFLYTLNYNGIDLFYFNQEVMNKIFKARCVDLNLTSLGELFQINKLFPDDYSRINFSYINHNSEKMIKKSISDILNNQK